uniref:Ssl1-like domain-containing protein n=1 Tax=Amphimedon queenslandica TaxID=400682 RepID=A0A1X7UHL6_AMPQE
MEGDTVDVEEDGGGYTWEGEYERPWEAIQEDIEGHILAPDDDFMYKTKRRKLFNHESGVKLGIMRHILIVVDSTQSMNDKDLKPNRFTCTKTVLKKFLDEFFDFNPISQMTQGKINVGRRMNRSMIRRTRASEGNDSRS